MGRREDRDAPTGGLRGRVITQHHRDYLVALEPSGEEQLAELAGKLAFEAKKTDSFPTVGDYVLLDRTHEQGGKGRILGVEPRSNLLRRTEAGTAGKSQNLAANVDLLFICMALTRDFNLRRLERYMAVALGCGIHPVLLLTKTDLADEGWAYLEQIHRNFPNLETLPCSAVTGEGLEKIRERIGEDRTVVFLGSSGVGKSTIINGLLGREDLATGHIRESDGRGRHTTTRRQLLAIDRGSAVIDSPGIRELALDDSDVAGVFADIEALTEECRFNDCTHVNEPGCAVRQAVRDGVVTPERYNSYMKLLAEEKARIIRNGTKRYVPLVYHKW